MEDNVSWTTAKLESLTGLVDMSEYAAIICSMKQRKEVKEFMEDLLGEAGTRNETMQKFIDDVVDRISADPDQIVYRKTVFTDDSANKRKKRGGKGNKQQKQPTGGGGGDRNVVGGPPPSKKDNNIYESLLLDPNQQKSSKGKSKKTQYIKIISDNQLSSVLLPGRNVCNCLAQRHQLINNCISCGRIVCEQEGEGNCMYCGTLVATPQHTQKILSQSKKGRDLERKLKSQNPANFTPLELIDTDVNPYGSNEAYDKAVSHKDKLLEFDRQNIHQTKVLDDETDYFQSTRWLSVEERKKVERKLAERDAEMHASKRTQKVTLDFAGRRVVSDTSRDSTEMGVIYEGNGAVEGDGRTEIAFQPVFVNPSHATPTPQYLSETRKQQSAHKSRIRNQDSDMQLLRDDGMCLTMHQPWASLLVHGIKQLEGRSWYSAHRGRLWIHSASKEAITPEITALEERYRELKGYDTKFPPFYPAGVVLGYVYVDDVIPHLENDEENSSEYLFVCSNPAVIPVPIRTKGKNKIWKLPKNVHNAVLSQLGF